MQTTALTHEITIPLQHHGDCSFVAVSNDEIVVEEFYDDEWLAQHRINEAGHIIESVDENYGASAFTPLPLSAGALAQVHSHNSTHPMHKVGLRRRGLREADRLSEWVQPLTVMEKIPLLAHLKWDLPPMLLMGIAESQVLAEAALTENWHVVCRCVRLAYALPQQQLDDDGYPYDYDTKPLYLIHGYDPINERAPALVDCFTPFHGIALRRPLDCAVHSGRLFVADGGSAEAVSRIIVWRIT